MSDPVVIVSVARTPIGSMVGELSGPMWRIAKGLTPDEVRRIIAAQTSREKRLAIADWVILNDGLDLAALRQKVEALPLP